MIVDKNSYNEIQDEVIKSSKDISSVDEINNLKEHIESKLENFKPTMMIYGKYNAGKSTLLNALFGQEEMAKTGDAPETKDIHEYEYNGYTIFDTPGLDAKSEDDIVTKEHLSKSEIIIFVLSSKGSLEEDYVYNKISEVVKANKPIILVINNKDGIEPESIESKELMLKVRENLIKIGDRKSIENIETKVNICMVNAKTALKAKLENKKLILKKSNISQLEILIETLLASAGNNEVINALNLYLQNFINSVIEKIDNKIDNVELQKTEELITYLEKYKQSSDVKFKNLISKNISSFKDKLTSMLLNSTSTDDINSYISDNIEDINNQVMDVCKNIQSNLALKVDDFEKEFTKIDVSYSEVNQTSSNDENNNSSFISDTIKSQVTSKIKDQEFVKKGAVEILKKAKDWLPKEAMHGIGPKTMEKMAGKAAIGINVAIEAYNMYSANKEHEEMIQRERNRTQEAKHSSDSISSDIQNSLFNSIDEMIVDTFNSLIVNFKDTSKILNNNNNSLLENKENLQSVLNKL